MPKDKSESHRRIVMAAKQEFLEKGYEKASMRSIGQRAGMTSAGLYRHYKNKEDMFDDLVKPAVQEMDKLYKSHMESHYKMVDSNAYASELFKSNEIDFIKHLFSTYNDEFKLILKCSQGTKYENFVHDTVNRQQEDFSLAMDYMREKGMKIRHIDKEELHMLLSAYTTAIIEPLIHEWPKDKAEHCLKTIEEFFMPGWRKIMGF